MKRLLGILSLVFVVGISGVFHQETAYGYDFGDYRSMTLTGKAWEALEQGDIEAVLAYTNKCIELYGEQARKMQADLSGYPTGPDQDIFNYWALNDVATSLFIQGEAYRKANMMDEAKEVFQKLIDEYAYGQCWDPKGWFWKPAEVAQERLAMSESGQDIDFGDYSSEQLTVKAWTALEENDLEKVLMYVNKCVELYGPKAQEMQNSLTEYPWESKEKIFSYWALNDVGTCLYIKGEAYQNAGQKQEAREAFKKLMDEYYYAQCWDPKGWFWKPAEAVQQKAESLETAESEGSGEISEKLEE